MVESLMWTLLVIMILEFLTKDVHVLVPEYHKMVQAFLLNRLNESLDEGHSIGYHRGPIAGHPSH
jgi:hypothetical protein